MNIMIVKKVVGVASSHDVYAPLSIRETLVEHTNL